MALLAGLLGLAGGSRAQFPSLATTDDGATLYVVTPFNLAGSTLSSVPKIFVSDAGGFRLYTDQFPDSGTVAFVVSHPWVSGDGSTVAYNGNFTPLPLCAPFGGPCKPPYKQTAVVAGGSTTILNGPAIVSANGRFAVMPAILTTNTGFDTVVAEPVLVDLSNGTRTVLPQPTENTWAFSVASDGTVLLGNIPLFATGPALYLWRPDQGLTQITTVSFAEAVMDDSATTILYRNGITLYLYDVATGTTRIFANGSAPSISRDGQWVALVSPVDGVLQPWAVARDGSQFLQLTSEPLGVTSAVISGNSGVVYAVTAANAILKFDLAAGTSSTVVGPTPTTLCLSPCEETIGSLSTAYIAGLVSQTITAAPPLPLSLGGYQLLMNGTPVPLASITPTSVIFQIPWEAALTPPGQPAVIQIQSPDPNPLFVAAPGGIFVTAFFPWFIYGPCVGPDNIPDECAIARHADGSAVSGDSPARGGEVVTLSMTGLGAVSPPVPTGEAAPADPPAVVQHALSCELVDVGPGPPPKLGDVPVLAARMTPGMVGTYQVTMQLPPQVGKGPVAQIVCGGQDYVVEGLISVGDGPPHY